MSNRVYLYCTDFQTLPKSDEWDSFFGTCGVEYEAAARIPLFWLLLFNASDVRLAEADHGDEDVEVEDNCEAESQRRHAYLLCNRASGVERLHARAHLLKGALDDDQFSLCEDWMARMTNEPHGNVLVRTEELDWMGEAGQLEAQLRAALLHLEQADVDGMLHMNEAMRDITGIWCDDMHSYEAFEFVGGANSSVVWPEPFAPRYRLPTVAVAPRVRSVAPSTKPWWVFWR